MLGRIAERRGWEIVAEYRDAGISGAKGRDQRPRSIAQAHYNVGAGLKRAVEVGKQLGGPKVRPAIEKRSALPFQVIGAGI